MDIVTHIYIAIVMLLVSQAYLVIKAIMQPTFYEMEMLLSRPDGTDRLIAIIEESNKIKHLNDEKRKFWIVDRIIKDLQDEKNNNKK